MDLLLGDIVKIKCIENKSGYLKILNKNGIIKHIRTFEEHHTYYVQIDGFVNPKQSDGLWVFNRQTSLKKEINMKRFKIGDRVRLTSVDGDYHDRLTIGATGVIKDFYKGSYDYKVEFDEWFNGHSCCGICKDGHGQNIYDKDLELESTKGEIMATNEVLKIYNDKKEKQLVNKYDALLENAKLNDPIYKSFREHADALVEIYKVQKMSITLTEPKLSDDTAKVIENLMTDRNKEYDELKEYINEVSAQLNMCETYEQRKDILKTYNIIGKDGKIKA